MLKSVGNSRVSEVDSRVDEVGPVDGPAPPAGLGVEVPRADRGDAHREGLGHEMPGAPAQHDGISERRSSSLEAISFSRLSEIQCPYGSRWFNIVVLQSLMHKVSGQMDIAVAPNPLHHIDSMNCTNLSMESS